MMNRQIHKLNNSQKLKRKARLRKIANDTWIAMVYKAVWHSRPINVSEATQRIINNRKYAAGLQSIEEYRKLAKPENQDYIDLDFKKEMDDNHTEYLKVVDKIVNETLSKLI